MADNKKTSKEKGDLLETVIHGLCSGLKGSRVTRNAQIEGKKSKTKRDVDVLIEGRVSAFDIKIAVEAKNYLEKVGVEKVESLHTKLQDVGADLGVLVSPSGFTQPAKDMASALGIQLFEVYDPELENSSLFIPVRFVEPEMARYQVEVLHRIIGPFAIVSDPSLWRIHIGEKILTIEEVLAEAWADGRIPQKTGTHSIAMGAVAISEEGAPTSLQYCELTLIVEAKERYFLKLFPASFFKNTGNGKEHHRLNLDVYSRPDDMTKHGWIEFKTREELDLAANIPNQPEGIRGLILYSGTVMDSEDDTPGQS